MDTMLFLEEFPFCEPMSATYPDIAQIQVISVLVRRAPMTMDIKAWFPAMPAPVEISALEQRLREEYGLKSVHIEAEWPIEEKKELKKNTVGRVLLGRAIKGEPRPISKADARTKTVTVSGRVFSVDNRDIPKRGISILQFDMTDGTGSLRVSKKISKNEDQSILKKIEKGMYLTVSGQMTYNKYSDETELEPRHIQTAKAPESRKDTASGKRVELHLHTRMSAMDALPDPAAAVKQAAEWGMPAIAITDHGVAQAFPAAAKAAKGIKVIYGMEGYYINDVDEDASADHSAGKKHSRSRHISLLVKNRTGLKNLYELITKSHLEHFHRNPVIPKSLLMQHREGLIIGSACEAGEIFQAIVYDRDWEELKRLGSFYDYFEIMPIANNSFMLDSGLARSEGELRELNRRVVMLGRELGIPVCATGDVHFLEPEDEIYRHILLNAKGFSDADKDMPLYFRTTGDMLEEFSYLGEKTAYEVVVKNTNLIADMVEGQVELLPELRLYPPTIENSAEQLKELVYSRLRELYGPDPEPLIMERVKHEMDTILGRHFDVIYMSAQKLVSDSVAHGYLVGSRGSVGSSIVAYLAGITEVNSLPAHYLCPQCYHTDFESGKGYGCGADMPDKYCPHCGTEMRKEGFDIPFATFLGIKGDKVPDIDLNFSGEYQANAHAYTKTLFGDDHVFKAGTVSTIAEKTAYGYVVKYAEGRGHEYSQAEMNRLAQGITGVKRSTGQHPGGLVIIPQDMDVTDFCPVQHPADDADSGIITTHLEYHFMEDYLLKLDELGHDNPTMINMLERLTGTDATKIRLDDGPTMSLFTSPSALSLPDDDPVIGRTGSIGIPEFGTGFTRQMLVDTQPDKFDMLVRLSGLSHGEDVWLGNAQDLIRSGKATVSQIIGCRDDIMLYLISLGIDANTAFKSMENVRKNRPLTDEQLAAMREHKVPEWYIESCNKITYLFPKAHAVAYVVMAFRIAWYKVHYPLAFYAALFYRRSQKNGFDAQIMTGGIAKVRTKIKEIDRKRKNHEATAQDEDIFTTLEMVYEFYMRGFDFAPIDLYKSDAFQFLPEGDKLLRVPFVAVPGLGGTAAASLAAAVQSGQSYASIEDVAAACPKVSAAHIRSLKELGAFGDMPESNQFMLFDS